MIENSPYINSRNLNADSDFPYLVFNVKNDVSTPLNPGFRVMHWHEDLQYIYVLEGMIRVRTLEEEEILSAGEGVFINKNLVHMVEKLSPCAYKSFLFPERLIAFDGGDPISETVRYVTDNRDISMIVLYETKDWCRRSLALLRTLAELEKNHDEFYCYEVQTRLAELWLLLIKNLPHPNDREGSVTVDRMRRFLQYIAMHYGESVTLKQLADSANVSESECLRCFHASLDTTPYRYLMDYRLSAAGAMLRETQLPIHQIAVDCGFGQSSYFGKCFREKMGRTPREYRAGDQ